MPTLKNHDEEKEKKNAREEKLLFSSNEPGFSAQIENKKKKIKATPNSKGTARIKLTRLWRGLAREDARIQKKNQCTKPYMLLEAKPEKKTEKTIKYTFTKQRSKDWTR